MVNSSNGALPLDRDHGSSSQLWMDSGQFFLSKANQPPTDTFLPFDLECTFSAAFVLVMAMNVHPRLLPQDNWLHDATEAFDYMTVRGNTLGSIRKSEVEELARTLNHELGHQGNKSNNNNNNATGSALPLLDPPSSAPSIQDRASLPSLGDPFFDAWIADDGLSGAQIMDLADALQPGTFDDFML